MPGNASLRTKSILGHTGELNRGRKNLASPLPFPCCPSLCNSVTQIVRLAQIHDSSGMTPLEPSLQGGVVSIGNFDGVHRGHAALLAKVTQQARKLNAPAVVVVFDPHPATILRPGQVPPRLTWIQRRAELLSKVEIDFLLVCETTPELLNLSAEDFFQSLIVDRLKAKAMVEGPNFFFGRDRSGNVETLAELCRKNDMEFTVVSPIQKANEKADDQMVSSTRVRILLSESKISQANEMLGSAYRIRGTVVAGSKRGREIGFPTANLSDIDVVVPGHGVYGGFVQIDSTQIDSAQHIAAIHIGPNPTFDDKETAKVEVHLLDYNGDLYGQEILVDFVTHVRGVVRFDSADQLTNQLRKDIATIRSRLSSCAKSDTDTGPNQHGPKSTIE